MLCPLCGIFYLTMKQKIALALKTKYASFGLSNEALDGVASIIEKTVTKEEDIANAIAGAEVESLIKVFQKDVDKYRNSESQLKKEFEEYKQNHPDTNPDPEHKDDKFAQDIAELKAMIKAQEAKLVAKEKSIANTELLSRVRESLVADGCENKGIMNLVFATATVADGDTEDSLKTKYKEAYNAAYKETFGDGAVPPSGGKGNEGYKKGDFDQMNAALAAEGLLPAKK